MLHEDISSGLTSAGLVLSVVITVHLTQDPAPHLSAVLSTHAPPNGVSRRFRRFVCRIKKRTSGAEMTADVMTVWAALLFMVLSGLITWVWEGA